MSQLLSNHGATGIAAPQNVSDESPVADSRTIALFHFEDEHVFPRIVDNGPRGMDLTANGGVQVEPGRFHNGLHFAGAKSAAENRHYGVPTPEMTYDFWIKPDGKPSESCGIIFVTHRRGGRADNSLVLLPDGRLGLQSGGKVAEAKTALPPDRWTHVTITSSVRNKRVRFYLDGQLDRELAGSFYYPHGWMCLGNPFAGKVDSTLWNLPQSFRGTLDEFQMLNVELEK